MSLSFSKYPAIPFIQNWAASAGDETAGYMSNWMRAPSGQRIVLQQLSCSHPRASHVRLFVSFQGISYYFNLVDDDFAADRDACWDGLLVMDNCDAIGCQVYNVTALDSIILKGLYQVIQP